jgi:dihydrolipoamide dehydrogenase
MASEITMPQLSDTMTEGTVVKWNKKEGDAIKAGEEIADVETDKATMPMEAFESGTLAYIAAPAGQKVKVGSLLAVIATAGENAAAIKKEYAANAGATKPAAPAPAAPATAVAPAPKAAATAPKSAAPARVGPAPVAPAAQPGVRYDYDVIVIGGGPAGYAAAIRAGQLRKRVLCVEKENLGGTCLNWGCIPTKSLLEDGQFVRRLRTEANEHGVTVDGVKVDFTKMIGRSRQIATKLKNGIGHLFRKYDVKHEMGTGQLLAAHKVKVTTQQGSKQFTAEHIVLAPGARATPLPGVEFDGRRVISSREAMTLPTQPKRLAIVGAGAIGCAVADFLHSGGSPGTHIEKLPHRLAY